MDRQSYTSDREKGFANWKFIIISSIIISIILISIITISIIKNENNIHTYNITPKNINSTTEFFIKSHNNNLEDLNISISSEEKSISDLNVNINKNGIANASFERVNTSSNFELGIDTQIENLKLDKYDTAKAYAIDPTKIEFENATIIINASGKQLFKCVEWNFTEQKCYGEWIKIMNLIPGEKYNLLITKQDPAFIETNQSEFDLGTYNKTFYNTSINAVQLNASYNNGTYLSKVFDAGGLANWTNISWIEGSPYGEELPNNKAIESVEGGTNMSGNVLLLHLNDGSGISAFVDNSGNNKNGSCSGADCPTWTSAGKFGGAYSFDGNDRIGTQITTTFNDFTIEVWFKDNGDNVQYERLADKSYTQCFWLGRNSNTPNSWGGGVRESGAPYGVFVTLQDSQWHQIVSIRNGTTHYIYGDGGKVIASNTVSNTACDATALAIGAYGDAASTQQRFTGIIDEVSFYNRSLSASEVLDHYKRGALKLNLTVRSCDDINCSGDNWNSTYENSSSQTLNITNNPYFQYKADFLTYNTTTVPELYNVTIGYNILDNIAPKIYLEWPINESINTTDKTPDFKFNATDETASTLNCSLWMNKTIVGIAEIKATNSSTFNGNSTTLSPTTPLSNGLYWWWISCSDGFNSNISEKRIINISVPDMQAPSIELVYPINNTINTTNNTPSFIFIPDDDIANILSCTLWLNETVSGMPQPYGTNPSATKGINATITANKSLSNANYTWWINCSDGDNSNISSTRVIKIYVDVNAPIVSLVSPSQNSNIIDFSAVNFTCTATDDIHLKNISLYSNYNGIWQFIENKNVSGTTNSTTFTKNILYSNQVVNNDFTWNCLAYDNTSKSNWSITNNTFSNWDLGVYNNTVYNTTLKAIILNNYGSDGVYTSQIFDAGSKVGWKNMSWYNNALNVDTELNYFNNSELKAYYSQNMYSVRNWYNITGLISDFSQLRVSAVLDCDGSCSGIIYIRIGNSTTWTDYAFLNASSVRTDGTTTVYTWYNNTYNISKNEFGNYFFVQLLVYTGSGTINFLMDESGPSGPEPQYRSGNNGDGGQSGWTDDNGDYAIKLNLIQNTDLNVGVRSCDDTNCNGESWSEALTNSTLSELQVSDNRYFQYKAYLESISGSSTPKLYNATINYGGADARAPAIILLSPINESGDSGYLTTFRYNVSDENIIESCELIIDGIARDTDNSIEKGIIQEFTMYQINTGTYNWQINCTDINGNENSSVLRQITVVPSYEYTGKTTDLTQVNIENITNLILEKPSYGLINFSEAINLSGGVNINSFVTVAHNLITIESHNIPQLNKSATLTLYNINFSKPIILKNNNVCNDCTILSNNQNLTFTVQGFSSYSASENSQIEIWDDTDNNMKYPNNIIKYYANYTNKTSGESINGIGIYCNITFSDIGTINMEFNNSNKLYTFNRTFNTTGIQYYTITCVDTNHNYASLNTTDYASINNINGPQSPDNITVIKSERANLSNPPAEIESQAGNLTELLVDANSITRSWQGYYGKVSGAIYLKNSVGSTFYNWNITQPKGEIYATRMSDVNFANINCSNLSAIANEEIYIGQNLTDTDSVRNTFNKSNHPQFYIGNTLIDANNCKATNLYVNSSAQDSTFYEILLSDGASNMIYTAILDTNQIGFDNQPYDFQMLVGENGNDQETTTYYFFVEIS